MLFNRFILQITLMVEPKKVNEVIIIEKRDKKYLSRFYPASEKDGDGHGNAHLVTMNGVNQLVPN
jgi:hypothetical protein